jgi:hypothetical protein
VIAIFRSDLPAGELLVAGELLFPRETITGMNDPARLGYTIVCHQADLRSLEMEKPQTNLTKCTNPPLKLKTFQISGQLSVQIHVLREVSTV